ncbi:hypothetical protein [Thermicanus aegyptius]|uniref:hypothetical protein n=1 Tax=Thermicanus aegyptius TaxID=94009 RepID=UPI00040B07AC|nr:hypothetical protein [Thermicanus aegyptius]
MRKKWFPLPLLFMFLLLFPQESSGNSLNEHWEETFTRQTHAWIEELIQKGGVFSSWRDGKISKEPLGPNSRTWLVTIRKGESKVGYLVIGEDDQGHFLLLEYGTDGNSLFDEDTLSSYYPDTKATKKEKIYQGISSYFLVKGNGEERVFDAKTTEAIPEEWSGMEVRTPTDDLHNLGPPLSPKEMTQSSVAERKEMEGAFPIEAILKKRRKVDEPKEIILNHTYLDIRIRHGKIHLLLPVVGFHRWDQEIYYIALDQEGYRFLPLFPKGKETDGKFVPTVSLENLFTVANDS